MRQNISDEKIEDEIREIYGFGRKYIIGQAFKNQYIKNRVNKSGNWEGIKVSKDSALEEARKAKKAYDMARSQESRKKVEEAEKYLRTLPKNPFNKRKLRADVEERKQVVEKLIYQVEANYVEATQAINNVYGAGTIVSSTVRFICNE